MPNETLVTEHEVVLRHHQVDKVPYAGGRF
jgi:hypothetical protein